MSRFVNRVLARKLFVFILLFACIFVCFAAGLAGATNMRAASRPSGLTLFVVILVVLTILPVMQKSIERIANHLFFGKRAYSYELVTSFAARVANALEVDEVLPRLAETAARSLHSASAQARVLLQDGEKLGRTWPSNQSSDEQEIAVDVRHGGALVGEIGISGSLDTVPHEGRQLLKELAAPAGLALATVRLTFDLRRRLEEVESLNAELDASRRRIVDAHRVERDRLLADIDRLVWPHLDMVKCDLEKAREPTTNGSSTAYLEHAVVSGTQALESLRTIAHGIFPSILTDSGLVTALRSWGEAAMPPVTIKADNCDALREFPILEVALYFVCVATVDANVRKQPAIVDILNADGGVHFKIALDGEIAGDLLQLVRDQIEALNGSISIEPLEARSWLLTGWLPYEKSVS